jgi:hypothetical protein
MSGTESVRILVVDDEPRLLRALCHALEEQGYTTTGFTAGSAALAELRETRFELLLADLMMPEMDGLSLLRAATALDPDLVCIIMTGQGTVDSAVEAMKAGALDYVLKPFKLGVVLPVLSRALTVRRLRMENAALVRHLQQRTDELEAANRELEAFSYSVSHDLRAPLRTIHAFSNNLIEDFSHQMPPEALRQLNRIAAGARQMARMIEDLLRFSRLGRQSLSRRPVSVTDLVHEVLTELTKENGERLVEVRVGDLPDCVGDPALLRHVFVNLLSNAFKFTCKREKSLIEVGCRKENGEQIYFVRDNGVGFDMQHTQKLFGVFQRLHGSGEFEGTGIGLSIVQRIVQRHGGRIWAEAAVDQGATFYFILPDSAPASGEPASLGG